MRVKDEEKSTQGDMCRTPGLVSSKRANLQVLGHEFSNFAC